MNRNIRAVEKRLTQLPRMRVFPSICESSDERSTNRTQEGCGFMLFQDFLFLGLHIMAIND